MQDWEEIWKLVPEDVRAQCPGIERSQTFSSECRQKIADEILPTFKQCTSNIALVFAGSLGRNEANETSDVDAFLLFQDRATAEKQSEFSHHVFSELERIVKQDRICLRLASAEGAFADACNAEDLLHFIGGNEEDNKTLTRRQLLLTEGQAICNNDFFITSKKAILYKYLADLQPLTDSRPIFLINDLIRYYRTICVDYEYKKNEIGKPWAVRLTKLRHSRKLLYFSCLLSLLESISIPQEKRINWLEEQFVERTPLERSIVLLSKYANETHWKILVHYNEFLEFMASPERRRDLDTATFERRDENVGYVQMRNNARAFRRRFNDFILAVEHWRQPIADYVLS